MTTAPADGRTRRQERRASVPDLSFAPALNDPGRARPPALDWPAWTDRERWSTGPVVMPLFDGRQQGGGAA